MKRLIDVVVAVIAILVFFPLIAITSFLIVAQDGKSPFYIPIRVGKDGLPFRLFKLRSMVADAEKTRVDTTAIDDFRITKIGHFIRKYKLDELPQFFNVLKGEMSLVGPRPNIRREVDLYTDEEKKILIIKPGITDISSIVFADLASILAGSKDPNLDYNQLIRPWKSRLILFYLDNSDLKMDIQILLITLISVFSPKTGCLFMSKVLEKRGAPSELVAICTNNKELRPMPPPGSQQVVITRDIIGDTKDF